MASYAQKTELCEVGRLYTCAAYPELFFSFIIMVQGIRENMVGAHMTAAHSAEFSFKNVSIGLL